MDFNIWYISITCSLCSYRWWNHHISGLGEPLEVGPWVLWQQPKWPWMAWLFSGIIRLLLSISFYWPENQPFLSDSSIGVIKVRCFQCIELRKAFFKTHQKLLWILPAHLQDSRDFLILFHFMSLSFSPVHRILSLQVSIIIPLPFPVIHT